MNAVAFSARQGADLLLLVGASEIEGRTIGARVHLPLAELNDVLPAGDFLPDVLLAVERIAGLIDFACRARGDAAIHSRSRARVRWCAASSRPSCSSRFCFCSSQAE